MEREQGGGGERGCGAWLWGLCAAAVSVLCPVLLTVEVWLLMGMRTACMGTRGWSLGMTAHADDVYSDCS